jgi:endonuclease YncB( thermonuclease family)
MRSTPRRSAARRRAPLFVIVSVLVVAGAAVAIGASAWAGGPDHGPSPNTGKATETGAKVVAKHPFPPSSIELGDTHTRVRWSDGDSFKIIDGPYAGSGVRLQGYNTLESYGPVHSWGEWTEIELYKLQKEGTKFARSRVWTCNTEGERDHYNRVLIECPDLIEAMVGRGYAHLFAFEEPPPEAHLRAQLLAIERKLGIWAKGVPDGLITSLHSADEHIDRARAEAEKMRERGEGDYDAALKALKSLPKTKRTYNRVADPRTGETHKVEHANIYKRCQVVCLEGSCMRYVPFHERYGVHRAECLRTKGRLGLPPVKPLKPRMETRPEQPR